MISKIVLLVVPLILAATGLVHGQDGSVTLESVTGLWNTDTVQVGKDVVFSLRVTNTSGGTVKGITNGFRVYSDDGAVWHNMTPDTLGPIGKALFDLGVWLNTFSTGSAADTVGFGASGMLNPGLPIGFDEVSYTITVGPIYYGDAGKTICLDSSLYPPVGIWKWEKGGSVYLYPDWDGPHCFDIYYDPSFVPALGADSSSLSFTAMDGNQPEDNVFTILISDGTDKSVDISGALTSKAGGDFTFTPASGVHGTEVTVSIDANGLVVGDYIGEITLSSSGTSNPTQVIPVQLRVDQLVSVIGLDDGGDLPSTFALDQNYPNPFNPTTEISFDLPVRSQVMLTVYNVLGQQVTTLVNKPLAAGSYVADWDGRSSSGTTVASGIYFYRLHTEQFTQTKKMVLLK